MVQKKIPLINSAHGSDTRNIINEIIKAVNDRGAEILSESSFLTWLQNNGVTQHGAWDKTETYEGLSVVLHEGTSYTSIKAVPSGVDISNENYWVVTGNYNAQVENYRQIVEETKGTLSDHVETTNTRLAHNADLSDLVWNDTSVDNAPALNAAISTGKRIILKAGELTIKSRVRLNDAPMNSYYIEGSGENTVINCVGAEAGFYDKYGMPGNENYHVKHLKDMYFKGDLTNTGLNFQSLSLHASNLVFSGFDKGIYMRSGGYNCTFHNIFTRFNKFGLYIDDLVTTCTFTDFYPTRHDIEGGAGIYFNAPVEKIKIQGLLQANNQPVLWYGKNFSGDVIIDAYFELNGIQAEGIEAVRNDSTDGRILYQNCKLPNNISSTRENGEYHIGHNVIFDNCIITKPMIATGTISYINCDFAGYGGQNPDIETSFDGVNNLSNEWWGNNGAGGVAIKLPLKIDSVAINKDNVNKNPFAKDAPSFQTLGTNQPTIEIDTNNKFGNYNSTKVSFVDNVIGSRGDNSILVGGDTGGSFVVDKGKFVVCSFLVKGNKKADLRISMSGQGAQPITQKFSVTTEWQKFLFIGANSTVAQSKGAPYLYTASNNTNFHANFTGVVIHNNIDENDLIFKDLLQGKFEY